MRRLVRKKVFYLCTVGLLLVRNFSNYSKTIKIFVKLQKKRLILGLILFCIWAWNVICAPDIFIWNFAFMLLNVGQVFHIIYQLRPVKFDPELEEVYHNLFHPFKVTLIKKIVSSKIIICSLTN